MIKKNYSRSRGPGILSEQYASDIFVINIDFLDDKINSITIFPTKYPYPDITVDFHTVNRNIQLDFSKITSVNLKFGTALTKNIENTIKFIEDELTPFLDNLLKGD